MKVLVHAEAALNEVERDNNKLQSRELRDAIQRYIDEQREAIKQLRRLYH